MKKSPHHRSVTTITSKRSRKLVSRSIQLNDQSSS